MAEKRPDPPSPSFGNMSDQHWSRARRDSNQEALEYYRQRSKAPGVAEGGAERNFYCMDCDGVIPHDTTAKVCPHCGASIEGGVKRYFNWVEMNDPPTMPPNPSQTIATVRIRGGGLRAGAGADRTSLVVMFKQFRRGSPWSQKRA